MVAFLQEFMLAIRSLRRSPGFVAAATISLALGIAANATIFAAVDAFLLRPLPYPEPERLAQVRTPVPERGWDDAGVSYLEFADWERVSRTLDLGAYSTNSFSLTDGDEPIRVDAALTRNLLTVLGRAPALGRGFRPEEETTTDNRVVLLSHRLWLSRFGGDSSVVGRSLLLNGEGFTVIGVMPVDFRFPEQSTDLWVPFEPNSASTRKTRVLSVVGRLRPTTTLEAAEAEMQGLATRLAREYPESNTGFESRVVRLDRGIYDDNFRQATMIVSVAVAFVLLIACANVANLMLARAAVQGRDLAVRAALGAGRWRLARKLLAESLVIALVGGVLGVVLSIWGVKGLVGMMPPWFTRMETIAVNGRLLFYILGISVVSGILFGLAPAINASRSDIFSSLRETGRTGTPGAGHGRLRKGFVVAEISLALVLLIAAGLMVKGAIRMQQVDLGFESRGLLTARVTLPENQYGDSTRIIAFYQELASVLQQTPGAVSTGLTTLLPMDGGTSTVYAIAGEAPPEPGKEPLVQYRAITPGYLETMRIPLRQGRYLAGPDKLDAPKVALINEAMRERHWPGQSPLGRSIVLSSGSYEIVGVVAAGRDFGPDDDAPAVMYVPAAQRAFRSMSLVVRTEGDPASIAPAIRELVRHRDAGLPLYSLRTMEDLIEESMSGEGVLTDLLGIFGGIALVLSVVGVYGVMAYSVAQRTQEVGIRMALGAQGGDILRLIVRQGVALTCLGSVIGLVLAGATTRSLSTFLFGVSAFDPAIFIGVTLSLVLAALSASAIPAIRASRVNPIVALKHE
jgi:putative ABC transport system permease protein